MSGLVRAGRRSVLVAGVAAVLGGCAQAPIFGTAQSGNPDAFEAQGRVYVRYGTRAFSGSLRWLHAAHADEVWLGGPLGQTAAHIVRDSGGAVLTTADQQVYRHTSIEALTREGLGWSLPLADLSYYVVGKVPEAASAERDANGRPVRTLHDGWSVRWVALEPGVASDRPGRVELTRDDVEIRFVVDRLDRAEAQ